jgi:hypothetical protein
VAISRARHVGIGSRCPSRSLQARAAPPHNRAAISPCTTTTRAVHRTPTSRNAGFQITYRQNRPMVECWIAWLAPRQPKTAVRRHNQKGLVAARRVPEVNLRRLKALELDYVNGAWTIPTTTRPNSNNSHTSTVAVDDPEANVPSHVTSRFQTAFSCCAATRCNTVQPNMRHCSNRLLDDVGAQVPPDRRCSSSPILSYVRCGAARLGKDLVSQTADTSLPAVKPFVGYLW